MRTVNFCLVLILAAVVLECASAGPIRQSSTATWLSQNIGRMTPEDGLASFGLGRRCDQEGETQLCEWNFLGCPPGAAFYQARTGDRVCPVVVRSVSLTFRGGVMVNYSLSGDWR